MWEEQEKQLEQRLKYRFMFYLPLAMFSLGLVAIYIGERALSGVARYAVSGLGALCLVAIALIAFRLKVVDGERRRATVRILIEYSICVLAIALYFVQSDDLGWIDAGKLQTALKVVWPALLILGLAPAVAMEVALAGMLRAPRLELWRVGFAARAARIVALAVIAFAGINYAASRWSRKVDLSYFKTTKPGSSTVKIVEGLTKPVRFILFFPPGNEVLEQAREYVESLIQTSDQASLEIVDQALDPDLARKLKVRDNGFLAIESYDRSETIRLGLEIENARSNLRQLDAKVQEKLLRVVRPARVAYLTTGHLERDYAPPSDDTRLAIRDLRDLLELLGLQVKRLGAGEGLAREVPEDASLVVIPGPIEPFLPEERAAISDYTKRGGRLLVFMDPDHGTNDPELMALFGLQVSDTLVANERFIYRVQGRGESPYNLVTTRSSSHPTVTTLSRAAGRLGVLLMGSGAVSKVDTPPADLKITLTLRSMAQSWLDENENGKLDRNSEKKTELDFAAAVESGSHAEGDKPMRAVVIADADVAGDGLIGNAGNRYFLADAVRWLVGDEDTAGTIESEKDVPIVHKKDEDTIWFYGTSALIPAGVLGVGLGLVHLTRRKRRS